MPRSTALEPARLADHSLRIIRARRCLTGWEVLRVGLLLAAVACIFLAVIYSQPLLFASFLNWRDVHPNDPRRWLFAIGIFVLLGLRRAAASRETAARNRLAVEVEGVLPERWVALRNVSGMGLLLATPLLLLGAGMLAYRPSSAHSRVQTRFWTSIHSRDVTGVRAAIARGAVINGRHVNGMSPLSRAVSLGDEATVKLLLQHGADPLYHSRYPPLTGAVNLKKQRLVALMLPYVDEKRSPYSLAELSVMTGDVASIQRELGRVGINSSKPELQELAKEWGTTAQLKCAFDQGR